MSDLHHPSFKNMMHDVVDAGSCCECGSCVLVCPHNLIEYVNSHVHIRGIGGRY